MKKALLLIIVLSMLLSLCACGNTGASTQEVTSNTQQISEPESVQTTNSSEERADQNVTELAMRKFTGRSWWMRCGYGWRISGVSKYRETYSTGTWKTSLRTGVYKGGTSLKKEAGG